MRTWPRKIKAEQHHTESGSLKSVSLVTKCVSENKHAWLQWNFFFLTIALGRKVESWVYSPKWDTVFPGFGKELFQGKQNHYLGQKTITYIVNVTNFPCMKMYFIYLNIKIFIIFLCCLFNLNVLRITRSFYDKTFHLHVPFWCSFKCFTLQNAPYVIRKVPLQNCIGSMNINCSALKEMPVFAQITAVQSLLFSQAQAKLCIPVQIMPFGYPCCANCNFLTLGILIKNPILKTLR